jgi:hypothetical protein
VHIHTYIHTHAYMRPAYIIESREDLLPGHRDSAPPRR